MNAAGDRQFEPEQATPSAPAADSEAENDLLRRLAAGERAGALAELSRRYAERLYDLGMTTLGQPGPAERLAADTLSAVLMRAPEFDPAGDRAHEFVYELARDRIAELSGEQGAEAGRIAGHDFETLVADVEFRAAVAGLGDEGRGVLEQVLGGRLTRAEAGDRLGLTVGIVDVRLRTALRAVRDALDGRGIGTDARR